MGIPILVRRYLYIDSAPWCLYDFPIVLLYVPLIDNKILLFMTVKPQQLLKLDSLGIYKKNHQNP